MIEPKNDERRTEYLTRDRILKMLSDDEVARVSAAEGTARLKDGEEYLDLDHLERGVQEARNGTAVSLGGALPKSAVQEATWTRILGQLPMPRAVTAHLRP